MLGKIRKDFATAGVVQSDEQILRVMTQSWLEAGSREQQRADASDAALVQIARNFQSDDATILTAGWPSSLSCGPTIEPLRRVARAVHFDLAVDLGPVDTAPWTTFGSYLLITCLTAAMLATAPPIATRTPPVGPLLQKA